MIEALDFFERYAGLRLPQEAQKIGKGICPSCGRGQTLYRKAKLMACSPCYTIRMGYPLKSGGSKFTLGIGDYAVVTERENVFYTNLNLGRVRTKEALTKDTGLYELFLDLINEPRSDDYLLVHFGKPTDTRTFRLNSRQSRDYIFVSGQSTIGSIYAGTIRAWLLRNLLQRYPDVPKKVWDDLVYLPQRLYDPTDGAEAAIKWDRYVERYPGIVGQLPEPRTIEAKLLEVAGAAIRSSTRSCATRSRSRRSA